MSASLDIRNLYLIFSKSSIQDLENTLKTVKEHLTAEPSLSSRIYREFTEAIEASILAKKNKYEELTDEDLENEMEEVYKYSRYLRRAETNFVWSSDDVPQGLLDEMGENELEEKALEFEKQRREFLKTISEEAV